MAMLTFPRCSGVLLSALALSTGFQPQSRLPSHSFREPCAPAGVFTRPPFSAGRAFTSTKPSTVLFGTAAGAPYGDQADAVQRFRQNKRFRREEDERDETAKRKAKDDPEWDFFDTASVNVHGGNGGNGCVAMRREKGVDMGGPSGGNGGRGGSVVFHCNKDLNTLGLLRRQVHYRSKDGQNGQGKSRHGPRAENLVVQVPPGTVVRDLQGRFAGELVREGDELVVARGGRGGRGNEAFKTPRTKAPRMAEKGEPGHEHWLQVELRLVADVGFIGVPNAGKSTLLTAASNAKPKIANYPFTTVVPNLGVCDLLDVGSGEEGKAALGSGGHGLVLADIPGLLEGAHEGVGLGLAFLRHVARCRVLVHVLDGTSEDLLGDFAAINQELELFSPQLALKPQVVVINKADLPEVQTRLQEEKLLEKVRAAAGHSRVMVISAMVDRKTTVKELMQRTAKLVAVQPAAPSFAESEPNVARVNLAPNVEDEDADLSLTGPRGIRFEIETHPDYPGQYRIVSKRLETLAKMTNWEYREASSRFERILDACGVLGALAARGASEGDLVMLDDLDFDYSPRRKSYVPRHLVERDAKIANAAMQRGQSLTGAAAAATADRTGGSPSALGGLVGFEAFAAGVGGGDSDLKDFDNELEDDLDDEDEDYIFDPNDFDAAEFSEWDQGDEAAADAAARAYWAMEAAAPASSSPSSSGGKAKTATPSAAQAPAVLPFGVKVYEIDEDLLSNDDMDDDDDEMDDDDFDLMGSGQFELKSGGGEAS